MESLDIGAISYGTGTAGLLPRYKTTRPTSPSSRGRTKTPDAAYSRAFIPSQSKPSCETPSCHRTIYTTSRGDEANPMPISTSRSAHPSGPASPHTAGRYTPDRARRTPYQSRRSK
ncbi:hypothetical protein B0H12DRAFT_544476 [Mycena haematopus]|nr:hypothetical protein B0H12DRAFT_544476 [Mycena haematopus]